MTNFDRAFEQVKKLVEDFQSNELKYLSSDYQEAEVRRDFIDKFLFALGWDVYHNEQKNLYEQEVKVEKGVYVGRQQKRADYAFHLLPNYRDVKFYVEAKKQLQQSKTESDKNYLTLKCEQLDKEIDRLVYQPASRQGRLYGLTEEEIKIVEERVK